MEKRITTSFIAAAEQVLQEIGFPHIRVLEVTNGSGASPQDTELLAMVGLVGDLKGHLVLHFPSVSSMIFVEHLSGHLGMEGESAADPQYRKAALAEISNQIGGKATNLLSEHGMDCMITPPTLLSGTGVQAALPEADDQYMFSVSGDFGVFSCILAIKNSKII